MLTKKLLVPFFAVSALVVPHAVRALDTFGTVDAGYSSTYSEASDWSYDGGASDYSYSTYYEPTSTYYDHNSQRHSSSSHHGGNNDEEADPRVVIAIIVLLIAVGLCKEY